MTGTSDRGSGSPPVRKGVASVTRLAYTVLILFGIAGSILTLSRGAVPLFILLVVVVIGFALVVIGLDKMVHSEDRYWKLFGMVLISALSIAVSAGFILVLLFVFTGHPHSLERYFPQQPPPSPRAMLDTTSESTATVSWTVPTSAYDGVKLSLFVAQDNEFYGRLPLSLLHNGTATAGPQESSKTLTHLESATLYKLRLVAFRGDAASEPTDLEFRTDADKTLVGMVEDVAFIYSGKLPLHGMPTIAEGELEFGQRGAATALWHGPIVNGLPSGTGNITEDGRGHCAMATFQAGKLLRATCDLKREPDFGPADGGSYYKSFRGDMMAISNDELMHWAGPSRPEVWSFGAINLVPHGQGTQESRWKGTKYAADRDSYQVQSGAWRMGMMDGVGRVRQDGLVERHGTFKNGQQIDGIFNLYGLLEDGSVPGSTYASTYLEGGYKRSEFTAFRGGVEFKATDGFQGFMIQVRRPIQEVELAVDTPQTHIIETRPSDRATCVFNAGLGLGRQRAEATADWISTCQYGNDVSCLVLRRESNLLRFQVSRKQGEAVRVSIFGPSSPSSQLVLKAGELVVAGTPNSPVPTIENGEAGLVVERICRGDLQTLSIEGISAPVIVANLCDRLVSSFARVYFCPEIAK